MLVQKKALVSELLEFRLIIEPTLAARAAANATKEEIAHLEDILTLQKAKVERGEMAIEEDSKFHYAIAQACQNSVVLKVLDVFMDYLGRAGSEPSKWRAACKNLLRIIGGF